MSIISYASTIVKRVSALRYPLKCKECINNVNKVSFSSSSVTARTIHDVNTNVAKDVILFKYENPSFYKYMNIFAVVQYAFWMYLGIFSFSTLKDAPVDKSKITEDTPWYRKINLGENKYKNTLGTLAVIIGKLFKCNKKNILQSNLRFKRFFRIKSHFWATKHFSQIKGLEL